MSSTTFEQDFIKVPRPAIIASVVLHICTPILYFTLQYLSEHNLIPFFPKKRIETKEVYQNFVQVDVVALPDAMLKDLKNTDTSLAIVDKPQTDTEEVKAKPATEEAPKVEEKVLEEHKQGDEAKSASVPDGKADAKKKEEKEKLEKAEKAAKEKQRVSDQEKALKRLQEEAARDAALKSIAKNSGTRGRAKLSGNKLSKGTAITGKQGEEKDMYSALVSQKAKEKFTIFPWMKKKKLSADLELKLYPNGHIRSKRIVKPSSDPNYDSVVLQAVGLAEPFPSPSDPSLVAEPFVITFTPE